MKYCFYCGKIMPDAASFCGTCGKEQSAKVSTEVAMPTTQPMVNDSPLEKTPVSPCHGDFSTMPIINALFIGSSLLCIALSIYFYVRAKSFGEWMISRQDYFERGVKMFTDWFAPEFAHLESIAGYIVLLSIISAILFLIWVYTAYKNISYLTNEESIYSSSAVIVGFIIPILNLFRPYQILTEIYRRSSLNEEKTALIPLWWGTVIISSFVIGSLSSFAQSMLQTARTVPAFVNALNLISTGILLNVIGILFTVYLVIIINKMQRKKCETIQRLVPRFFSLK